MTDMDDRTVTGRVLAVLDGVGAADTSVGLATLTRRVGLPKATVRRIADDLVTRRLLLRDGDGYRLGPRLADLGSRASRHDDLRRVAMPYLQDIYARSREIVWLSTFSGSSHTLVEAVFGPHRSTDMRRPWSSSVRGPGFAASAAGRILLADRPGLLDEVIAAGPPRMTPYSDTGRRFLASLRAARDSGVAVENEQCLLGYNCVAAAIRAADGSVGGVIGVVGRTGFAAERMSRPLLAAAAGIERGLDAEGVGLRSGGGRSFASAIAPAPR
jgi:DNA-binding IclR family transcriptional regulator